MKIGIDCRMYTPHFTGIGRYTYELVQHLLKINETLEHPHTYVLFLNDPHFNEVKDHPRLKKILTNAPHYSLREQTHFLRLLYKEKLDLVHFPHFNVPLLYRRPFIVTIHDLILTFFPGKKHNTWYRRLAYNLILSHAARHSKKIIAVSHNTKKDIIAQFALPEDKIQVIYNGIGPEFQQIPDRKPVENTLKKYGIVRQFLLYTGVWRSHKNLPRLIEAFSLLAHEKQLNIHLVISGKPDPHYPEVKEAVKRHNLSGHVIFTGLVTEEELIHLYNAAAIYVFPSLYEGFGLPPLEAMRCGTPVAASHAASIPEICGEENALFFDPYNVEEMASTIEELYKNPTIQLTLIERGMQHSATFSWEHTVRETFKLYLKSTHV